MKRLLAALIVGLIAVSAAQAHFIWILPAKTPDKAQVIFSDSLQPDDVDLLKQIAQIELFSRDAEGKTVPLKKTMDEKSGSFIVEVPGTGPRAVGGSMRYGVLQRGKSEPFLLNYYGKTYVGVAKNDTPAKADVFNKSWDRFELDIVPLKGKAELQVLWKGKPLADADVVQVSANGDKSAEKKTDAKGIFPIELPKEAGLIGVRVRHIEKKEGELDGKQFKEIRHYATFVLPVESAK